MCIRIFYNGKSKNGFIRSDVYARMITGDEYPSLDVDTDCSDNATISLMIFRIRSMPRSKSLVKTKGGY
jgi:hypothetical protein